MILRYVFAADMVRRAREEGLLLDLESATEMLSKAQVGMLPEKKTNTIWKLQSAMTALIMI